ncbi:MAG: M56 family metallopeptidase [Pseudomonadota bacterium]
MSALIDFSGALALSAQTGLAVAILTVIVLLLRKPVAKRFGAKVAYALWAAPVLRLILPPLPAGLSPMQWFAATPTETSAPVLVAPAAAPNPTPSPNPMSVMVNDDAALTEPLSAPLLDTSFLSTIDWPMLIVSIWFAGAIAVLAAGLFRQWRFARLIAMESDPVSPTLDRNARRIARTVGLKRVPALRTSLIYSGPLVAGLLRPVVLLPAWFEEDYTLDEQSVALTHEFMHVRRRDLWALQAAQFVHAAQWLNPLAGRAMKAFRADQEAACDADVLAMEGTSPQAYGKTLVKAVRLAQPVGTIPAMGLTLDHAIKDRLIQMQRGEPTGPRKHLGAFLVAGVSAAALLATAAPSVAQAHELAGGDDGSRGHVFINGDRRMILVGNPFEGIDDVSDKISDLEMEQFDLNLDVSGFDFTVDFEGDLTIDIPLPPEMPPMPPIPPFPEFADVETVTTEDGIRVVVPSQSFHFSGDSEAVEAWAEAVERNAEAWAEQAEAFAEQWEAQIESQVEAQAERIAAQAERIAAQVERTHERRERQIERQAERHARQVERLVERELEPMLDDAEHVIDTMSDACDEAPRGEVTVVSADSRRTGQSFKALCVTDVSDREIDSFIAETDALTAEEKRNINR